MRWSKLGNIFKPDRSIEWMHTHAAVPFLDQIDDNKFKLYFTSRNRNNVSIVASAIMSSSFKIMKVSSKPVINPGGLGMFDENGVTASYFVDMPDEKLLYLYLSF